MANQFDVVVIGAGPGRLRRGDSRRAARASRRLHRRVDPQRQVQPRGHLPQRRLHSVQGAARVLRELSARRARVRRARHRGPGPRAGRRADADAQGRDRRQLTAGIAVPVQEEQGHVMSRPGQLLGGARRRLAVQVARHDGGAEVIEAKHVIIATGSMPRHCRWRRSTTSSCCDNDGALALCRGAGAARRDRRRRDRPGDGQRVEAPGRRQ